MRKDSDVLRAAQLYYLQDLTMDAIARELRTSRSTVSRLLQTARDTGLVQFQVRSSMDMTPEIEQLLHARFGVIAHVVPTPGNLTEAETLDRVAVHAARTITPNIDSNAIIGVAWGATISAVSRHLSSKPTQNSVILQLNGAGNTVTTGISYASEILRRFGRAYAAKVQQFPVPAFFDHESTKEAMWRESSVTRMVQMQSRMTMAVFGVGSMDAQHPSHVYAGGYLGREDLDSLAAENVVGDVATVFFRADGSTDGITLNRRSTGPDHEKLKETPRRICVVSGLSKLTGLKGALAAGLVTELILDERTARALLGN